MSALPLAASARPQATRLGRAIGPAGAALVATAMALGWVTVANDLAGRGMHLNEMLSARRELTLRRAGARVALGVAADPRRLAERARALGFGPPDEVAIIVATVPESDVPMAPPAGAVRPDADSALALRLAGARPSATAAPSGLARLMTTGAWSAPARESAP